MRGQSLFPPTSIDEAAAIASVIAQKNAGQPMRRLAVFEELDRSPDSGPSRGLVTASSGYGLTSGGYQAERLKLTDLGRRLAVEGDASAKVDAVLNVTVFRKFFDTYKNNQFPSSVAGKSFLADNGIPADRTDGCLNLILENGKQAGLVRMMSGAERVLSREHALEESAEKGGMPASKPAEDHAASDEEAPTDKTHGRFPSLNINFEIQIPGDQSPEVYDAIFGSMRKHLIDVE